MTITASAPGFVQQAANVDIVQPALRIEGLATSIGGDGAIDEFFVRVGIPNAGNASLATLQAIRPRHQPHRHRHEQQRAPPRNSSRRRAGRRAAR